MTEPMEEEVQHLREERDRLKAEVEKQHSARRSRLRAVIAAILVALTILLTAVTVPAAWARRTVFDTDHYVEVIGPLAKDPAVQAFLAQRITDQVMTTINVQQVISDALPPKAAFLAGPMTDAIHGFVQDKVLGLLASDTFAQIWVQANTFVHDQVIAILDGQGDTVSVKDGVVLLNLLPLVNLALQTIQSAASGLIGDLPLPQITVGEPSPEAIAKIESALGIDLPDDFGSIPVYNSNDLHALQVGVQRFQQLVYLLIALLPLLFAAALIVSQRRRRTLLQLLVGMAVAVVVVRRLAIAATDGVVDKAATQNKGVARAVVDPLVASLRSYTAWFLLVAVLALIVTLVTGPYPWARSLRAGVVGAARAIGSGGERLKGSPALDWVTAHRDLVMGLVGAVAVLIFLLTNLGLGASLLVLVIFGAIEAFVWLSAREPTPEGPAPDAAPAPGTDA